MIGYVCKYTPVAIFNGFKEEAVRLNPAVNNFDLSDSLMHPNMCSYSKAIVQEVIDKNLSEVVLVTCCDSIRRVRDVIDYNTKGKYIHIIDLPRKNSCCSKKLFKNSLIKFIRSYEEFSRKTFDIGSFKKAFDLSKKEEKNEGYIAVVGARISDSLLNNIETISDIKIINETCTDYSLRVSNIPDSNDLDELMEWYAGELLNQRSCMRMEDISSRRELLEDPKLLGIIYHTVKFCDYYHFEYSELKNSENMPLLKIETDYTQQSEGQIRTRLEAFIESLKGRDQCAATTDIAMDYKFLTQKKQVKVGNVSSVSNKRLVAGIDSGSTSTNVVILDENKNIVTYSVVKTGAKCIDGANKALEVALKNCGLCKDDLKFILSTGYGRVSIPFGDDNVTEITCHAKGAYFLNSKIRTVIDIGGQDSKVIRIDESGNVKDFVMNDKCAAGTGRFLDMMARTLEIDINDMGKGGLKWKEDIVISNMCTVFAESEIISLIAQNKEKSDIIHGLNKSIAGKTAALISRVGKNGDYMMTGGVAKNIGVVREIEKLLGSKVFVWDEPQICGALGAALIALERV